MESEFTQRSEHNYNSYLIFFSYVDILCRSSTFIMYVLLSNYRTSIIVLLLWVQWVYRVIAGAMKFDGWKQAAERPARDLSTYIYRNCTIRPFHSFTLSDGMVFSRA